jgi:hypothetical protein
VFTLLSAACDAESYTIVGDGEGYVAFVDTDSVTDAGSVKSFNLLRVDSPPKLIEGHAMHYMIEREKIDCREQTIQMVEVKAYGLDDQMFEKADGSEGEEIILPNSIAQSQFNLVCQGVRFSPTTPPYKTLPAAIQAGEAYAKAFVFKLPGAP